MTHMYIDDFNIDWEAKPHYPLKLEFSEEFMEPYRELFDAKALELGTKENPMISLTDGATTKLSDVLFSTDGTPVFPKNFEDDPERLNLNMLEKLLMHTRIAGRCPLEDTDQNVES